MLQRQRINVGGLPRLNYRRREDAARSLPPGMRDILTSLYANDYKLESAMESPLASGSSDTPANIYTKVGDWRVSQPTVSRRNRQICQRVECVREAGFREADEAGCYGEAVGCSHEGAGSLACQAEKAGEEEAIASEG